MFKKISYTAFTLLIISNNSNYFTSVCGNRHKHRNHGWNPDLSQIENKNNIQTVQVQSEKKMNDQKKQVVEATQKINTIKTQNKQEISPNQQIQKIQIPKQQKQEFVQIEKKHAHSQKKDSIQIQDTEDPFQGAFEKSLSQVKSVALEKKEQKQNVQDQKQKQSHPPYDADIVASLKNTKDAEEKFGEWEFPPKPKKQGLNGPQKSVKKSIEGIRKMEEWVHGAGNYKWGIPEYNLTYASVAPKKQDDNKTPLQKDMQNTIQSIVKMEQQVHGKDKAYHLIQKQKKVSTKKEKESKSDPICHSAGGCNADRSADYKAIPYPINYKVPDFGPDPDIVSTQNNIKNAEKSIGKKLSKNKQIKTDQKQQLKKASKLIKKHNEPQQKKKNSKIIKQNQKQQKNEQQKKPKSKKQTQKKHQNELLETQEQDINHQEIHKIEITQDKISSSQDQIEGQESKKRNQILLKNKVDGQQKDSQNTIFNKKNQKQAQKAKISAHFKKKNQKNKKEVKQEEVQLSKEEAESDMQIQKDLNEFFQNSSSESENLNQKKSNQKKLSHHNHSKIPVNKKTSVTKKIQGKIEAKNILVQQKTKEEKYIDFQNMFKAMKSNWGTK